MITELVIMLLVPTAVFLGLIFIGNTIRSIRTAVKRIPRQIRFAWRWCTEAEFRSDINYRNWGVRTSEIPGSNCGLCGEYVPGDPGDPADPPAWRWTTCQKCLALPREDQIRRKRPRHLRLVG